MASPQEHPILEGEFVFPKKKGDYQVTLTQKCVFFHQISSTSSTFRERSVQISDIIGCRCLGRIGKWSDFVPREGGPCGDSSISEATDPSEAGTSQSGAATASSTTSQSGAATTTSVISQPTTATAPTSPGTATADSCGIVIYAYPFRKKLFSNKKVRHRKVLIFGISSSYIQDVEVRQKVAEKWRNVINCLCRGVPVNLNDLPNCVPPPQGKILFLINPFSGSGKARTIFNTEVATMVCEAGIPYHVIVTEYAGHAGELIKNMNLSEWYAVVIVSGDGLIFEIVNGIMQRADWASSIKHPIGCLPGGSGNALCCSINYSAGEPLESMVVHSTFILIKHRVQPMDLVVLHTPTSTIFSFLSVTWGIMADVDFESENYRKLGEARFTVGAIKRIINLRSYKGRISFLPIAEYIPRVSPNSSRVLSKVRRVSLNSHSSSTINSTDSKSSNSVELLSYSSLVPGQVTMEEVNADPVKTSAGQPDNVGNTGVNESQTNSGTSSEHACVPDKGDGDSLLISHNGTQNSADSQTSNPGHVSQSYIKSAVEVREPGNSLLQEDATQQTSNNHTSTTNGGRKVHTSSLTIISESHEVKVKQETYHSKKADFSPVPAPLLPPLGQEVPNNWVTVEGSFISVAAVYQTHLGSDMFAAPDASLSDGIIHFMMVKEGIPRNALLNLFLSFSEGKHLDSPYVDAVKVLAFRIEPASTDGNIMIDGERFDPTPIQGQILPGLARIMAIK